MPFLSLRLNPIVCLLSARTSEDGSEVSVDTCHNRSGEHGLETLEERDNASRTLIVDIDGPHALLYVM